LSTKMLRIPLVTFSLLLLTCDDGGLRRDPECYLRECRARGYCTYVEERNMCLAVSDADCRQSDVCKMYGACSSWGPPYVLCYPRTDQDCAQSDLCRDRGSCVLVNGECAPGSDEDCRQSVLCLAHGLCLFRYGECQQ
jgi:hypothetical protein